MVTKLKLLTVAILFHASSAFALPMLSADGSSLTGVDVGGSLYDVLFGDGIPDIVYAGVTWDAARETEANAVSAAIATALNAIGGVVASDIAGCAFNPLGSCLLLNPTGLSGPDYYRVSVTGTRSGTVWGESGAGDVGKVYDSSLSNGITLVTYRKAAEAVPVPATLALLGLGLVGLGFSRRRR